jgi:hypothetical protein
MSSFEKDFKRITNTYPKLGYTWNDQAAGWIISGELDICDQAGLYWDTFNIGILIPSTYPYAVPVTVERNQVIPREMDWHISPEGLCCVDIPHSLLLASRKGIRLAAYMEDKVYPFFANFLHKLHKGCYAGEEYEHHFDGVLQFYRGELSIESPETAIILLKLVINQRDISPNKPCPCGSGKKLKFCHGQALPLLKSLGTKVLKEDLAEFIKLAAV